MRQKPLLLVDVDGVISLFGFPRLDVFQSAEGSPRPEVRQSVEGSLHTIEGIPHFLSHTAAAHLRELAGEFELVWASGWEERADEHLPHLLGLPSGLPYLRLEPRTEKSRTGEEIRSRNAHWKLDAIDAYALTRPLAWIDDSFNDACHAWAAARAARTARTLLVQTHPARGLTSREARQLREWAAGS